METPGLLSRIRHLNNNNDETTRLKLTENIDLKLYYLESKKREAMEKASADDILQSEH